MRERFHNGSPGAMTLEQARALEINRARARKRQAAQLAAQGRGDDTEIAHVARGEVVIPEALQTPELLQVLRRAAAAQGIPLERFRVGSQRNSINPNTGVAEFAESPAGAPPPYVYNGPEIEELSLLAPKGEGPVRVNQPYINSFFSKNYAPIDALAKEMKVPTNYMLGMAIHESDWGRKNNLLGRGDAQERPYKYASPQESLDAYRKSQWYSRLQGKDNLDDFVGELNRDPKNMYNEHPGYEQRIRDTIDTVNRRLPVWGPQR